MKETENQDANGLPEGPYQATLVATNNYYPFGMLRPGQHWESEDYRYGYNGKEMDNEWNGSGNSYDYGFRIYNPRLARFLSVDPLAPDYPWYTPYQFAGNMPIWAIDLDGLEPVVGSANYGRFVVLGGERHVEALSDRVQQIETDDPTAKNANWTPVQVKDINDAAAKLKQIKEDNPEVKIEVVVITLHGSRNGMNVASAIDAPDYEMGASHAHRNSVRIGNIEILSYLGEIPIEINDKQKQAVQSLEQILSLIESGGTCVIAGCNIADNPDMLETISKLGHNNVSVIINGDQTVSSVVQDVVKTTNNGQTRTPVRRMLNRPLTSAISYGWQSQGAQNVPLLQPVITNTSVPNNLQLNSTGQPYEFIPTQRRPEN